LSSKKVDRLQAVHCPMQKNYIWIWAFPRRNYKKTRKIAVHLWYFFFTTNCHTYSLQISNSSVHSCKKTWKM